MNNVKAALLLVLAGALSVFSFAPFYFFPAMWLSLAGFFISICYARHRQQATAWGFLYGCGFYLANIHWVYISLHTYGAMHAPLAVFFVFVFSLYLALFPALAVTLSYRLSAAPATRLVILLPTLWTIGEWLRSTLFTGFAWAHVGYSHLPYTPLAGFAPIGGIYSVSLVVLLSVALVVWTIRFARKQIVYTALALGSVWGGGYALQFVSWTTPYGRPLSVSLIQGNIPQAVKWHPDMLPQTLHAYLTLIRQSKGEVVILPETAIPIFLQDIPLQHLNDFRRAATGRALITGIPTLDENAGRYYNSAVFLNHSAQPIYHKQHLVPFGEYIPLRFLFGWLVDVLHIPLTDFSRGTTKQLPFAIKDQKIAFNVCYEDTFAEEIIQALPSATILANISNLAWFDGSIALAQHGQIAQARALETGRPMLRATNTGLTAMIDHQGQFIARAPERQTAIITAWIQGRSGMTPYAYIGNWGVLAVLLLLIFLGRRRDQLQSRPDQPIV